MARGIAKRTYKKSELTPAKQKFAQVYAKTDNATEAAIEAYPDLSSRNVARVKGHRLLTNDAVSGEIMLQKQRLEQIASKAVARIEQIVEHGKEHNALQASIYAYDQTHGKATQQIETRSTTMSISIDLTGEPTGTDS